MMVTYELGLTIAPASDPPISLKVPGHYLQLRLERTGQQFLVREHPSSSAGGSSLQGHEAFQIR